MNKALDNNDVSQGIAEYTRLVLAWTEQQGSVRKANAIITKFTALGGLLAESEAGRAGLESLFSYGSDDVRLSAAIAALKWNPGLAVPVLQEIEARGGYKSFAAEWALIGYWDTVEAAAAATPAAGATDREPGSSQPIDKQARQARLLELRLKSSSSAAGPQGDVPEQPGEDVLDTALGIHSLIMNGGLDHAYEVRGHEFPMAEAVFVACGADAAGAIVAEFLALLGGGVVPSDMEARADQLAAIGEAAADGIEVLSDRYFDLPDVQVELEDAE